MFNKNLLKISVAGLAALTFAACSGSDSGSSGDSTSPTGQVQKADYTADYTAGNPVHTSDVVAMTVLREGDVAASEDLAAMFIDYPALAHHVDELDAVDKVVETQDGNLELYAGSELVMVISGVSGTMTVINSRAGFSAESIDYAWMGEQTQGSSALQFVLKECMTKKEPAQEQEQQQGKVEEDILPDQEQEQAQGKVEEDKVEQEQDKEEPAICEYLTVILDLNEIQEKPAQEQEQSKVEEDKVEEDKVEQDKVPDQGQS